MAIVAFILTALAGVVIGIWLALRASNGQMSSNPTKIWAFVDLLKHKTIEAYAAELVTAIGLKFPDDARVTGTMMADFIAEYTKGVLEHEVTRR